MYAVRAIHVYNVYTKHISALQHLGPTSRAVTPLCWWCQPDQREVACWGHPHPRRAGPLGPPQGVMSGPDLSGTWGDRTQETSAPINSSLPSKPRQSSALGHVSQVAPKTFYQCFYLNYMKPNILKTIFKSCQRVVFLHHTLQLWTVYIQNIVFNA